MRIDTYYDTVCTIQYDTAIVQRFFLIVSFNRSQRNYIETTTLRSHHFGVTRNQSAGYSTPSRAFYHG